MLTVIHAYRGFAALLVVLFHANATAAAFFGIAQPFKFGAAGVQFFFVLSGYIIMYVHERDIGSGEVLPYIKKRALRIYPIYMLITAALVPFWLAGFGEPYTREWKSIVCSLLLIPQDHPPNLSVAWTLIHEVIFYLMFAALILNKRIGIALFALWLIGIASIGSGYLFSQNNLLFFLGMLAVKVETGSLSLFVGTLAFLALGIAVDLDVEVIPIAFGLASFLIVTAAKRMQGMKSFNLLGDASYAIYLIHYPAISLFFHAVHLNPYITAALAAVFALACGILVHLYIERPMTMRLRAAHGMTPRC